MLTLYQILYIAATVLLLPPFGLLVAITAAALLPSRRRMLRSVEPGTAPRFLFVIPAHDEEQMIRRTVAICRAVVYDPERFAVLVIADNCTDGTAAVARAAGAGVIERSDPARRSKGYALEDTFADGGLAGYDAVVVVDADTVVDPNILAEFAVGLAAGRDWMQGYYSVRNADASWRTRLLTYAFSLFNGVWLAGQDRLGMSVPLRGNGMCFSARGLARVPWRVHGLTEDLEFAWALRLAGERVRFVPRACVRADMLIGGGAAAVAQRRRWEAGRRGLRGRILGPLLCSETVGWYRKPLYLIDLCFPPLVMLVLALLAAASAHLLALLAPQLTPLARSLLPVHAAMALILALYSFSPVVVMRLPARYLLSLAALPYYAAWKLATSAGRQPTAWVRTQREPVLGEEGGA